MRGMDDFLKLLTRVGLLAGALFFCPSILSANNQELSKVREQIQQKQQEISTQKKSLQELHQQLQKDEEAVNSLATRLRGSQAKLNATRKQLQSLEAQGRELTAQLQRQERLLADQLDHAYRMGNNDYLKLLLNQ